jgi:hypothetical protein
MRRDLSRADAPLTAAELAQLWMHVVIAVHEAHRDAEAHEHVGQILELVIPRPQESPIARLDHFGVVLLGVLRSTLDEFKVAVRIADEQITATIHTPP